MSDYPFKLNKKERKRLEDINAFFIALYIILGFVLVEALGILIITMINDGLI